MFPVLISKRYSPVWIVYDLSFYCILTLHQLSMTAIFDLDKKRIFYVNSDQIIFNSISQDTKQEEFACVLCVFLQYN